MSEPATELWNEIKTLKSDVNALTEQAREIIKLLIAATGKLDNAVQRLLLPVIEETDSAGTGVVGRRKRSTSLDAPSAGDEPAPKERKQKSVREMSGELVTPGSGKRGCSKCHRTGHRAKNCPN